MNKAQFIEKLTALLSAQSEAERGQLIDYYTEMIDDRVEVGLTEEEAVAALGEPEALARDFSPAEASLPEALPAAAADPGAEFVDALREVRAYMRYADILIRREPLANGAAAQLQFSDPGAFEYRVEGGVLVVTEKPEARRGLFSLDIAIGGMRLGSSPERKFTLTLAETVPDQLIVETGSGDVTLTDVQARDLLALSSGSGDIELSRCGCGGRVDIATGSGDASGDHLNIRDDLKVKSASGDIALRHVRVRNLRMNTASGDVEISGLDCESLSASGASGDLTLNDVESAATIACATTGGDIKLSHPIAPQIHLNSTSGDIRAELENRAGGYSLDAHTLVGSIRLPKRWTPPEGAAEKARLVARTTSGDIHVSIAQDA